MKNEVITCDFCKKTIKDPSKEQRENYHGYIHMKLWGKNVWNFLGGNELDICQDCIRKVEMETNIRLQDFMSSEYAQHEILGNDLSTQGIITIPCSNGRKYAIKNKDKGCK